MNHNNRRFKPWLIFLIAGMHLLLSILCFAISFDMTMDRFDNGGSVTFVERCADAASAVLNFPLVTWLLSAPPKNIAPRSQDILIVLNSLLWGVCVYAALNKIARRKN